MGRCSVRQPGSNFTALLRLLPGGPAFDVVGADAEVGPPAVPSPDRLTMTMPRRTGVVIVRAADPLTAAEPTLAADAN